MMYFHDKGIAQIDKGDRLPLWIESKWWNESTKEEMIQEKLLKDDKAGWFKATKDFEIVITTDNIILNFPKHIKKKKKKKKSQDDISKGQDS